MDIITNLRDGLWNLPYKICSLSGFLSLLALFQLILLKFDDHLRFLNCTFHQHFGSKFMRYCLFVPLPITNSLHKISIYRCIKLVLNIHSIRETLEVQINYFSSRKLGEVSMANGFYYPAHFYIYSFTAKYCHFG